MKEKEATLFSAYIGFQMVTFDFTDLRSLLLSDGLYNSAVLSPYLLDQVVYIFFLVKVQAQSMVSVCLKRRLERFVPGEAGA